MITTANGVGVDDDTLFFVIDLFAILAAMISRLKSPSFQNHNIIVPVSIPYLSLFNLVVDLIEMINI